MSWRDRDYARADYDAYGGGGGIQLGLPKPTPIVLRIMLACVAAFVVTAFTRAGAGHEYGGYGAWTWQWGSLALPPREGLWQVWRWITYQYLHGKPSHLLWNMLGLYFFGPPLERLWGPRRFFIFYTGCGIAAGSAFGLMQVLFGFGGYLIGASGCILGCLAACAVLFPHQVILLLFFPLPIRFVAILLAAIYSMNILWAGARADAAHLAGMAAGAAWVYYIRRWPTWRVQISKGAWQRKLQQLQADQERVDQILDKIRREGMGSLTWRERRFLKQASERRRRFDEQQQGRVNF